MVGTAQTSRPASRQHRTPCPGCGHDGTRKNSGSNVSHLDPDPAKGIADRRCRLCTVIRECASVLGASGILEVRGDELVMEELVDGEAMAFAVKLSNRQGRPSSS